MSTRTGESLQRKGKRTGVIRTEKKKTRGSAQKSEKGGKNQAGKIKISGFFSRLRETRAAPGNSR